MNVSRALMVVALVLGSIAARADDWPQWMGPKRDGVWRETGIVRGIPPGGLPVKWRVPVKAGYSGPAVVGGRVYLMDYDRRGGDAKNDFSARSELSGTERVLCLDATTGKLLWKHEYDCPYAISYASGPRCTPTIADGKVYSLGAEGDLRCLDAATGDLLWSKSFKNDYGAATPIWGFCSHPLVDGDRLVCVVGGAGSVAVAFDRQTGRELWRNLSASEQGYCPPTIIESGGRRQLMIWDADKLNALDPATGKVLWSQPLKPSYGMSIIAPQVATTPEGQVLFASGIGQVGALFRLSADGSDAKLLWRGKPKNAVYCSNSTPFIAGDTIYGCDCETGFLTAVNLANAERRWEAAEPTTGTRRGRHGTAFLVRQGEAAPSGSRTWIFSETGDLILATLSPDKYEELGRMRLLEPTNECFGRTVVWSHPAFADRCVFARNDAELVCVSLAE